jgi:hypothetical protein
MAPRKTTRQTAPKPRAKRLSFRGLVTSAPFFPRAGIVLGPLAVEFLAGGGRRAPSEVAVLASSFKNTNDQNSRAWVGEWRTKGSRSKTEATVTFARAFGRLTVVITGTTNAVDDVLDDNVWAWSWTLTRKAEPRRDIYAVELQGVAKSFENAALAALSKVREVEGETCGLKALVRPNTRNRPFDPRPAEVEADVRAIRARADVNVPRATPAKKKAVQTGLAFG